MKKNVVHIGTAMLEKSSVAFLCGNSVHGVIPLNLKNSAGRPHRLIYRQGLFGVPNVRRHGLSGTEEQLGLQCRDDLLVNRPFSAARFRASLLYFGRPHGADERVQRITQNFFAKCGIAPS